MSKSQWCTFEIDLKLTSLLVDVAWRSHQKKVHGITASDQEPGGFQYDIYLIYKLQTTQIKMWYMRILINQWSLIGGWCFTFNHVCVLWLQIILSCQNCARKSVESKKGHGDHKAVEHGLENRRAVLPISSNILMYRISKDMKRTQRRIKSMVQFLCLRVLSSPISKASRTQLS